ncbi:MAG TPA: hypothetical protein VNV39_17010 [Stellaceae bacterium]|jgi:hypothetical protein|nr:hypothetical protein [Stellaceae bacterium]
MNSRPVKPKEYFTKLFDIPEGEIDYADSPPTTMAEWEDAEVLLPVTADEFRALKEFILNRRQQDAKDQHHPA